jgi:hypothetical protein
MPGCLSVWSHGGRSASTRCCGSGGAAELGTARIGGPRGYGLGGVGPAAVCPCRRAPGLVCFGVYALPAMVALPQVSMLSLDRSQSL